MNKQIDANKNESALESAFGSLAPTMLEDSSLRHIWRISFVSNFFNGPVYRHIEKRFGLLRPEIVLLYCLRQEPGLVARDVCLVTGLPKNSISRAVTDLIKKQFVIRAEGHGPDKRIKPLYITKAGIKTMEQIEPMLIARQESLRSALTENELNQFDSLIHKIYNAMPEWVTPE